MARNRSRGIGRRCTLYACTARPERVGLGVVGIVVRDSRLNKDPKQ